MLDLVPLTGAGRKMTDRDVQCRLIGKLLQLQLPEPQAPAIAATPVGSDENGVRLRVNMSTLRAPPAADGGHREGAGVMVGPDIDETGIATNVIDAIRVGTGNCGTGEIVTLNLQGLLGRQPLLAGIVVIAQECLLLGVDRNHGDALPQTPFHRGIDVPELRIAVGVIRTLLGLAIALQAVVQVVQNLRHFHVADRMILLAQFSGNGARALTYPAQCRLRVPARLLIDQRFERLHRKRQARGVLPPRIDIWKMSSGFSTTGASDGEDQTAAVSRGDVAQDFEASRGERLGGAGVLYARADQHTESSTLAVTARRRVGSGAGRQGGTVDEQDGRIYRFG